MKTLTKSISILSILALLSSLFSLTPNSNVYASTSDPLDGKSEEEIEKEVNEYFEKVYEQKQKENKKINIKRAGLSDNQVSCMGQHMGATYKQMLYDSTVLALLNKDKITFNDIKKVVGNAFKNAPKATIIGFSYQFYKAHRSCHNIM